MWERSPSSAQDSVPDLFSILIPGLVLGSVLFSGSDSRSGSRSYLVMV